MEIENEEERSVDSFQAELDLVHLEEEEENKPSQKERLAKMMERLKAQNTEGAENKEENQDNNNPDQNTQILRAQSNVLRGAPNKASSQKDKVPEPFVPNFNLNERYFYQNININEWNDITNFIEKFVAEEKMGEKDLKEFFEKHPKISKGNVLKLQGSIADIFSKKKNLEKYKLLTHYLIQNYYKPKPVICECYFFPNPSNEQRVVNMFRTCKKTLDIAIFTFTRDSIAQAILEAHQRGLKIRCIGDDGNSKVKGSDVRLLASVGIPCKTDNNFRFHMHNKMAIIDNSVVITGSFNWTNQAINKNQDNILFIEDKDIANQYTEYFNKIWDGFTTVITPEEAKKYIEDEKKEQERKNKEKEGGKTAEKKETKKGKEKEKTTEKKETKKEEKKEKEKKQNSASTTKKEKEKEKKSTSTSKGKTTKKEKPATSNTKTSTSKEKTTKEKKAKTETKKTTKAKTEKRSKTMKEIKKGSTVKGTKEKVSKSTKSKSEKPKTTKEKKKEKAEKAKNKTAKRVRGVKSTTKSTAKNKK